MSGKLICGCTCKSHADQFSQSGTAECKLSVKTEENGSSANQEIVFCGIKAAALERFGQTAVGGRGEK